MAQPTSAKSPDYKALFEQAEESRRRAEERQQREADLRRRAEERNQATTFDEYIDACHTLLSARLQVGHSSRSTKAAPQHLLENIVRPDCASGLTFLLSKR